MKSDFIEGMEILIDCKRLVEDLVRETERKIEFAHMHGKDISYLKEERKRYLETLRWEE